MYRDARQAVDNWVSSSMFRELFYKKLITILLVSVVMWVGISQGGLTYSEYADKVTLSFTALALETLFLSFWGGALATLFLKDWDMSSPHRRSCKIKIYLLQKVFTDICCWATATATGISLIMFLSYYHKGNADNNSFFIVQGIAWCLTCELFFLLPYIYCKRRPGYFFYKEKSQVLKRQPIKIALDTMMFIFMIVTDLLGFWGQ